METRQIHTRDLSTVTGIQQFEHAVQSIYFLGLEDFEGNIYISIESDDYSNEAIPLTNNTFIIGQPMTLYNTTYICQIYGVLNDGEKIQLSKRFRLIVDKSNDIQGDSSQYPVDPNFTNGIIEFVNEQKSGIATYSDTQKSEIEATGDAVIESIPSDYTALSTTVNGLAETVNHLSTTVEYITPINWLDESKLEEAPSYGTHFSISDYIPVKLNDVCRYFFGPSVNSLTHSSCRQWIALNANKEQVAVANNVKEYTVADNSIKYIRVVIDTDKTNYMVQINTLIMAYSEYFEPYYVAEDNTARESISGTNGTIESIVFGGKMHLKGTYQRGSLTNGSISQSNYRVAQTDLLSFNTTITVYIADGFKAGFHLFQNDVFVSDSGWKTRYHVIPQGYSFKFVIARSAENTSEVITDLQEFINAISIKPYLIQKAKGINPCFMSVSHRGYPLGATNDGANLLSSYTASYYRGFECVETDIQWSSDGVPVCCHDETFTDSDDGTTIITISEHTVTELKAYGYHGETIASLEEVLTLCKQYGMKVQFDKIVSTWTDAQWNTVFSLVSKLKMQKFVIWQVPYDQVSKVLEYDKFATLMLLTSKSAISTTITQAKAVANDYNEVLIALYYSGVTVGDMASYNAQITERNISIGMYTIDDIPNYLKYVPYASFITSNRLCLNDIVG